MSYNNSIETAISLSSGNAPSGDRKMIIMSKAQTPSQLKAEITERKDVLLEACLEALNQIPNQHLKNNLFPSTYALAAQLSRILTETR